MKEPASCVLWSEPERVLDGALRDAFRLLDTFVQEDHFSRRLLACRECGQRYLFEFYEEIDWVGGDDPLVDLQQSVALEKALREAGVEVTLVVVEGGGHGDFMGPEVEERVRTFLDHVLRGGSAAPDASPIVHAP